MRFWRRFLVAADGLAMLLAGMACAPLAAQAAPAGTGSFRSAGPGAAQNTPATARNIRLRARKSPTGLHLAAGQAGQGDCASAASATFWTLPDRCGASFLCGCCWQLRGWSGLETLGAEDFEPALGSGAVLLCWLHSSSARLAGLPLDLIGQHFERSYGISVQGWGSWFGDQAKALGSDASVRRARFCCSSTGLCSAGRGATGWAFGW